MMTKNKLIIIKAIGRGQRQLILGDRYTGKTSIKRELIHNIEVVKLI